MRLFLAINLPDEVRDFVSRDTASLVTSSPDVAWVRAELLHVTLRFVGEREPGAREAIERVAREVAGSARPFDVVLSGVGAFPNFRRPRVVWLGMRNADPMTQLARRLDDALCEVGETRPDRPFRPHLTLGRVKRELASDASAALERCARALSIERSLHVHHLDLMTSELSSRGPTYSVLAALPLGRH